MGVLVKVNYQTKIMKKTIGVIVLSVILSTGIAHAGPLSEVYDNVTILQGQVKTLQDLTVGLQRQIDELKNKPVATIAPVIDVTSQIALTNTRVDAVEKRMSTLETAISYIQKNVMDALNTTIGLLKQLLKIK